MRAGRRPSPRAGPAAPDFVTLDGMRHALAKELSGGQSMLLQIARALMVHPLHVFLMDEPFAGVHPTINDTIMEAILRMNREEARHVPHRLPRDGRAAPALPARVGDGRGQLIAEGTLEEVANHAAGARGVSGTRRHVMALPRRASMVAAGYVEGIDILYGSRSAVEPGTHHRASSGPTARASPRCSRRSSASCTRGGGRSRFDGRPIHALAPHDDQAARHQLRAAGRNIFPQLTVAGEPAARRLGVPPGRGRAWPSVLERAYAAFPRLARAAAPARHRRCRAARPRCSRSPRSW